MGFISPKERKAKLPKGGVSDRVLPMTRLDRGLDVSVLLLM